LPFSSFSDIACTWLIERTVAATSHGRPRNELTTIMMPVTTVS